MTSIDDQVDALTAEVERLRSELQEQSEGQGVNSDHPLLSRRGLLLGAVAGAAAGILGREGTPALAANGQAIVAGTNNTDTAVTGIVGSNSTGPALQVTNYFTGTVDNYADAFQAYAFGAGLAAVYGRNDAAGGAGLYGYSASGLGASLFGGMAPVRLQPAATPGAPITNNHQQGEIYVDAAGTYWVCTSSGTPSSPGTFKQLATLDQVPPVTKLADVVLTGDTNSIVFTNIPQTYRALRLEFQVRLSTAAPRDDVWLIFNGDTSAVYGRQVMNVWNGASYPYQEDGNTVLPLLWSCADQAPPGESTTGSTILAGYASSTFAKAIYACGAGRFATGASGMMLSQTAGHWSSTAPITQIQFQAAGTNLLRAGSQVVLYAE